MRVALKCLIFLSISKEIYMDQAQLRSTPKEITDATIKENKKQLFKLM